MQLKEIYKHYLQRIGRLDEEVCLGPRMDKKVVEDKDTVIQQSRLLSETLNNRFRFNNKIIIIAVVLLCILFAVGVILVFYYRDSPSVMGGVFGGTFLSLLSIISRLHKLWKEKNLMDITIGMLEGLPPEKAAEFISTIYWKQVSASK
jgi:uncharacterized protein with PQ loop repeat